MASSGAGRRQLAIRLPKALIEVKLGGRLLIEEGVKTLLRLDGLIQAKKGTPPAFKMVLTAVGQFAYRRPEDGVLVCPIGCLKM